MLSRYNTVVIGAGPAGVSAACLLAKSGLNVLMVDKNIGGNYRITGSVVSNTILYLSYLYNRYKTKTQHFISYNKADVECTFDFKKTKKYIDAISLKLLKVFKEEIDESGVELCEGSARFIDKNTVLVQSISGESKEVYFEKAIVATGSYSVSLPNITGKKILDSTNIYTLDRVPQSVSVIGGGFVGCEYATFFKRLGSEVNIIESKNRILSMFDEQITKKVEEHLKKDGVNIIKGKEITNIEKIGHKSIIFFGKEKIESEEVFAAIGRKPNIMKLGLDAAGVDIDGDKAVLDIKLKSSNQNIYFIGDASGTNMFVNWAYRSSEIVVNDILKRPDRKPLESLPRVLYIDPEVACIGYTEDEAKAKGFPTLSIKYSFSNLEMSIITGCSKGFVKIIYDKDSKNILGAHIIGKGASELVAVFSLIIQSGIKIDNISEYIFNHPTFAEVLLELGNKLKK